MEVKIYVSETNYYTPKYDRNSLSLSPAGFGLSQSLSITFIKDDSAIWDIMVTDYYRDYISKCKLIVGGTPYDFEGFIDVSSIAYDKKQGTIALKAYDNIELISRVANRSVRAQGYEQQLALDKVDLQGCLNMVSQFSATYALNHWLGLIEIEDDNIPEILIPEDDKLPLFSVDASFANDELTTSQYYTTTTTIYTGFYSYREYNYFIHTGYRIHESLDPDLYEKDKTSFFCVIYKIFNNIQFHKIIDETEDWAYDADDDTIDLSYDAEHKISDMLLRSIGEIPPPITDISETLSLSDEDNAHYTFWGYDTVTVSFHGNVIPKHFFFGKMNERTGSLLFPPDFNINALNALKTALAIQNKDVVCHNGELKVKTRIPALPGWSPDILFESDLIEFNKTYSRPEWRDALSELSGDTSVLEAVLKDNKYFINGESVKIVCVNSLKVGYSIKINDIVYVIAESNYDYNNHLCSVEGWKV